MKWVLILLGFGLGSLLYVQWEIFHEQPPQPASRSGDSPAVEKGLAVQSVIDAFVLDDPAAFEEISRRPLFVESRRPPESTPKEVAPPEAKKELNGLDLKTVLITPQRTVAWLMDAKSSELVRLEPGGKVRGWTVEAVQPDRLLLIAGEETAELVLRKFPAQAAPVAPPVRQKAQQLPKKTVPRNRMSKTVPRNIMPKTVPRNRMPRR